MKKKINKYDIALIVSIIIINVFLILNGGKTAVKSNSKTAYIQSNNELVSEYVLTEDVKDEVMHIENGQIWIQEASCPHKICILQGKISKNGEAILCIPNRLFIKIVDTNDESDIDFIAD